MKAIERLKEYIDQKGISNRALEQQASLSNGYIATQLKRNADLGESVIIKILDNCLDLSLEWLLLGKGEMLISNAPISTDNNSIDNVSLEYIKSITNELINKSKEIGRLEERNRQLEKELLEHKKIANLSKSSDLKSQLLKPDNKINPALIK